MAWLEITVDTAGRDTDDAAAALTARGFSDLVIEDEQELETFLDEAEAWQAQYEAIDAALSGPNVLPMNVMYFATYPENDRVWGRIGGHIFCYG